MVVMTLDIKTLIVVGNALIYLQSISPVIRSGH